MEAGGWDHANVRRRARPWRFLSAGSGLLLAACFFLPAIRSCNSDIVPASSVAEDIIPSLPSLFSPATQPPLGLLDRVLGCVNGLAAFLWAYLGGLLLAIAAMTRLRGQRAPYTGWILAAILAGTAVALLVSFAKEPRPKPDFPSEWYLWLLGLVGPILTVVYLPLAIRSRDRLTFCPAFILSFWMVWWFGTWFVEAYEDSRYGLHLSLAAAVVLLVATTAEARAVTRQSWVRTLGQLLTGRLARSREFEGCCPKCDYLLYGLTEMRCPECGRTFTFEEVGLTPEQLRFRTPPPPTHNSQPTTPTHGQ